MGGNSANETAVFKDDENDDEDKDDKQGSDSNSDSEKSSAEDSSSSSDDKSDEDFKCNKKVSAKPTKQTQRTNTSNSNKQAPVRKPRGGGVKKPVTPKEVKTSKTKTTPENTTRGGRGGGRGSGRGSGRGRGGKRGGGKKSNLTRSELSSMDR